MSSRSNQTKPLGPAQTESDVKWYTLASEDVASRLQVDPAKGLSVAEVQERLQKYVPNKLASKKSVK